MNPRSLFNIILKVFGLFFLREIINSALQTISSVFLYFTNSDTGQMLITIVVSLAILALYAFLVVQLLFKTNSVIDLLKLDQGFDENELSFDDKNEFPIHLSTAAITAIALIVIGGVILIDEVPNFCKQFYLYFSERNDRYSSTRPEMEYMIFSGVKILIALLIIGERNSIIHFIENRKRVSEEESE